MTDQPEPVDGGYPRRVAEWRAYREEVRRAALTYAAAALPVLTALAEQLRALGAAAVKAQTAARDAYALAPPPAGRLDGARVHVLISDEWTPVPGITDIGISGGWADDPTPSQTANPPEPPVPRRPSRAARRGNRARPAWQTPYGPAPRHH